MEFLKLHEAAKVFGIPYSRLRIWALSGEIPAFRSGEKGTWRVNVEQVKEALLRKAA